MLKCILFIFFSNQQYHPPHVGYRKLEYKFFQNINKINPCDVFGGWYPPPPTSLPRTPRRVYDTPSPGASGPVVGLPARGVWGSGREKSSLPVCLMSIRSFTLVSVDFLHNICLDYRAIDCRWFSTDTRKSAKICQNSAIWVLTRLFKSAVTWVWNNICNWKLTV